MITDVCVPLTELAGLIEESKEKIYGPECNKLASCPIIAHAGDGNFHVLIMFEPSDSVQAKQAKALAQFMAERAIALGGTCTGEHGVGTGKRELLVQEAGPGSIEVMRRVKGAMDPGGF